MSKEHAKEVEKQKGIEESIIDEKAGKGKPDPNQDNVTEKGKKRYDLDTLKRNVPDEEKERFKKMDETEQRRYIINQWVQENRTLDKKDMHEISLEEEKFIGLQT